MYSILLEACADNAYSAFIIQVYGAAMAAGDNISYHDEMTGLHIYMAGVGVQQLFVLMFVVCAIFFHLKILRQQRSDLKKALLLLYVLYACLALITVRTWILTSNYHITNC